MTHDYLALKLGNLFHPSELACLGFIFCGLFKPCFHWQSYYGENAGLNITTNLLISTHKLFLKAPVHWQSLYMKTTATATRNSHYCTCLGHLGQHKTDRIISIEQGKYSSDCCMLLSLLFLRTNFANVHEPLEKVCREILIKLYPLQIFSLTVPSMGARLEPLTSG
jgi:hypothetical protein